MELLIVIAIIGILVSIAAASYITAQKQSRDQRRISDMKAIQNAWEQYFADNNANYPSDTGCAYSATPTPGVMSGTYMPGGFPKDPRSGTPYPQMVTAWRSCSATTYCFCAGIELTKNASTTLDCAGVTEGAYPSGFYCVKNLQ